MKIVKCSVSDCAANATCSLPAAGPWTGKMDLYCDHHGELLESSRERVTVRRGR